MYEKLIKWAAKKNMQFKVDVHPGHAVGYVVDLWMCDKVDGFCGAELVTIEPDGSVFWHHYRFRMRKNEEFVDKFINVIRRMDKWPEPTDWVGYDDSPMFTMPVVWKSEPGTWKSTKGTFYWVDKLPDDTKPMLDAGCKLLKSNPEYASEMVSDVVFVPNGVRFEY